MDSSEDSLSLERFAIPIKYQKIELKTIFYRKDLLFEKQILKFESKNFLKEGFGIWKKFKNLNQKSFFHRRIWIRIFVIFFSKYSDSWFTSLFQGSIPNPEYFYDGLQPPWSPTWKMPKIEKWFSSFCSSQLNRIHDGVSSTFNRSEWCFWVIHPTTSWVYPNR